MASLGDVIEVNGQAVQLTGIDPTSGRWIGSPVSFGSPFIVGSDLAGPTPATPSEEEGWSALAAQERAAHGVEADPEPTPEDQFQEREMVDYDQRVSKGGK